MIVIYFEFNMQKDYKNARNIAVAVKQVCKDPLMLTAKSNNTVINVFLFQHRFPTVLECVCVIFFNKNHLFVSLFTFFFVFYFQSCHFLSTRLLALDWI